MALLDDVDFDYLVVSSPWTFSFYQNCIHAFGVYDFYSRRQFSVLRIPDMLYL